MIYDLFSQERENVHDILSSEEGKRYVFKGDKEYLPYSICCTSSLNGEGSEKTFYIIEPTHDDLFMQVSFLYDKERDPDNPYFVLYMEDEEPEAILEEDWNQRISYFGETYIFDEVNRFSD